jgi:hypothetical protein
MEKSQLYKKTTERIKSANRAGVMMAQIVRITGVSQFRLSSIAKFGTSASYTHQAALSDAECDAINKALDEVKEAL